MFKAMRRQDRQVSADKVAKILEDGEYGVLSTVDLDGYAYGVPLSYVYKDDNIYFHCANEGQKLDNIQINNKVSFCVVGGKQSLPEKFTTLYQSVIAFGQASIVGGQEKDEALLSLIYKYAPNHIEKGKEYIQKSNGKTTVVKIAIEHITGKVRPE